MLVQRVRTNLKAPIHPKLNCNTQYYKKSRTHVIKKLHEKLNWMFSGTAQVSLQVYQFFVSSVCLLVRVTSWYWQVNWGNCGIPWVNCEVSVWRTTGKDSSEACAITCQNCAVYSVFPSGMMSHSKIAQFNWQCIAPFTLTMVWKHNPTTSDAE